MSAFWNRRWDAQRDADARADQEPLADSEQPECAEVGEALAASEWAELDDGREGAADWVPLDHSAADSTEDAGVAEAPDGVWVERGEPDAAEEPGVSDREGEPRGQQPTRNDPAGSAPRAADFEPDLKRPRHPLGWSGKRKRRGLVKPDEVQAATAPHERLLILDTWQRSGLPAGDFAPLVGLSKHTLYLWKKLFAKHGPAGLAEKPRGAKAGSKLPEVTRRTILMLKQGHPEWGCQRISDELVRGPAMAASAGAVARVLHEAGYQLEERVTRPHPDKVRRFERARPNQLWQTDLFTFVLKRQNRRLHLVGFLDDHSRFIVGYGLHASASSALVLEVLRAAVANYGPPEEILTDNGPQYVTWRGKSQFSKELEQQGIRQIVSRPKHPQTLGKVERFWGTLWRECLERAVFLDLEDARRRIGLFIDHYNFQRPHQGLEGATPADRFFQAAPTVLATLRDRVAANSLELARQGLPRAPFYMTGQVAGQPFSVHAEGERVFLTRAGQPRQEVELVGPATDEEERLPDPLCPHAAPESPEIEVAEVPPPGVSWADQGPPLPGARTSVEQDAWREQLPGGGS